MIKNTIHLIAQNEDKFLNIFVMKIEPQTLLAIQNRAPLNFCATPKTTPPHIYKPSWKKKIIHITNFPIEHIFFLSLRFDLPDTHVQHNTRRKVTRALGNFMLSQSRVAAAHVEYIIRLKEARVDWPQGTCGGRKRFANCLARASVRAIILSARGFDGGERAFVAVCVITARWETKEICPFVWEV